MNKDNKEYAITKIESIECGSSTNLCGGLLQGLCTILDRGETKNDVASVLLLTDGLANHGNCFYSFTAAIENGYSFERKAYIGPRWRSG